jgi:hypothetical protein
MGWIFNMEQGNSKTMSKRPPENEITKIAMLYSDYQVYLTDHSFFPLQYILKGIKVKSSPEDHPDHRHHPCCAHWKRVTFKQ